MLQSLLPVTTISKNPVKDLLAIDSINPEITGFNREASVFRIKTRDFKIETEDFHPETTTGFNPTGVFRPKAKISNRGKKSINRV
jgi:hypothetical protein